MLEHDADRLVSHRKPAGDSDDEIIRLLTECGVAEDHSKLLVATALRLFPTTRPNTRRS